VVSTAAAQAPAKLWSIGVPTALHELADDIVMAERRRQLDLGYNTISRHELYDA